MKTISLSCILICSFLAACSQQVTHEATLKKVGSQPASSTSKEPEIVCTGKTSWGQTLEVTIHTSSASVKVTESDGSNSLTQDFPSITKQWDGHIAGLITAPGLAVRYQNEYGCIRDTTVITNIRGGSLGFFDVVHMKVCRGNTKYDDLCIRNASSVPQ